MKTADYKNDEDGGDMANDKGAVGKSWQDGLISAQELQTKQFKPVRIILPELIPEGVTILAGKPKIGKSFLALDVCLAVADETRFVLGDQKPIHGDALYLALEDNQRRLKKRLHKIIQGQGTWSPRLQLQTAWKRVDHGGLEDIEAWCKSVEEPRLIWIDTLAKLRPLARRNEPAYDGDYRAIEGLQKLAGEYPGLGIVLNHHLRKMSSEDDAFDDVSGTLGLTGAADTIIVMKRHAGMVKVFVRGRDVEEGEFAAEFNRNTCRWRLVGGAEDVFRSKERQAILSTLGSATEPMSIPDIMAATERTDRCATKALLHKMRTAGEVVSEKGRYSLSPADLSNAVDRVDRDNLLTPPSLQSIDDADGFPPEGRSTAAVNGRSTVNGGVDRALTTENSAKCLKDSQNSRSGQQVNAVNAIQHGAGRARLRARAAALAADQA
jgi:AAA domain